MAEHSHIAWTDDTWNPWRGCTKVSAGCAHCYAEKLVTGKMRGQWGKGAPRVRSKTTFDDPLKWNKRPWVCDACGSPTDSTGDCDCGATGAIGTGIHRRRVFSLSLGDWLDPEVPVEWLADMLDVIRRGPALDFLLLTKRPELWDQRMTALQDTFPSSETITMETVNWVNAWQSAHPPRNVWLGVSVENQAMADFRIPQLLQIPAQVRFLSVEPLLEHVEFSNATHRADFAQQLGKKALSGIDWVIVGGESGSPRRDCGVDAIVDVARQCQAAGVPVFVKQDCAFRPGQQGRIPAEIWRMKEFPKRNARRQSAVATG